MAKQEKEKMESKVLDNGRNPALISAMVFGPAVVTMLSYLIILGSSNRLALLVLLHALTAIWVILYRRKRLGNTFILPISMLLSAAGPLLYDGIRGAADYSGILAIVLLYSLPWVIATLIVAGLSRGKDNRRKGADGK